MDRGGKRGCIYIDVSDRVDRVNRVGEGTSCRLELELIERNNGVSVKWIVEAYLFIPCTLNIWLLSFSLSLAIYLSIYLSIDILSLFMESVFIETKMLNSLVWAFGVGSCPRQLLLLLCNVLFILFYCNINKTWIITDSSYPILFLSMFKSSIFR